MSNDNVVSLVNLCQVATGLKPIKPEKPIRGVLTQWGITAIAVQREQSNISLYHAPELHRVYKHCLVGVLEGGDDRFEDSTVITTSQLVTVTTQYPNSDLRHYVDHAHPPGDGNNVVVNVDAHTHTNIDNATTNSDGQERTDALKNDSVWIATANSWYNVTCTDTMDAHFKRSLRDRGYDMDGPLVDIVRKATCMQKPSELCDPC
jgi:hypothetical protein